MKPSSALQFASKKIEHVKSILKAMKKRHESWLNSDGNKALVYALRNHSWEIARLLVVAGGAAINVEDIREENALLVAFEEDAPAELIEVILEQNADIEQRNLADETPLLIAARRANCDGLNALI